MVEGWTRREPEKKSKVEWDYGTWKTGEKKVWERRKEEASEWGKEVQVKAELTQG